MRYESLLASRYIKAQKRQSAFTVISIAAAVAVITMVFVLYSVCMNCLEKNFYSSAPYHLVFNELTEKQGESLADFPEVRSVKLERTPDGVSAYVLFGSDIGDREIWLQNAARQIGAGEKWMHSKNNSMKGAYEWNDTLMVFDDIGDGAHLFKLRIFCIFFIFAILIAFALRLIIDTAFEVSSKERERHYGVLQSVGATPEQIVRIITWEGMRLCVTAIPLGLIAGIGFAWLMYNVLLAAGLADLFHGMTAAKLSLPFSVDPKMLLVAAAVGIVWVFLSAYGVGMRIIKKAPMEAIITRTNKVEKVRKRTLSGLLFGISGSIASRNARRQKKRFAVTVLTLTVSITMFALFSSLSETVERSINGFIGFAAEADDVDFEFEIGNYPKGISIADAEKALADSGLFENIGVKIMQELLSPENGHIIVYYVNRDEYKRLFGADAAVSYDELVSTGGYVYNADCKDYAQYAEKVQSGSMQVSSIYRTLREDTDIADADFGDLYKRAETEIREHSIDILGAVPMKTGINDYFCLFGAAETHEKIEAEWFGVFFGFAAVDFSFAGSGADGYRYNAADLEKAREWFRAHSDLISTLSTDGTDYDNYYSLKLNTQRIMATVRAGVLMLNLLLAFAALINLLNIISTGIANRRSELASLQCVGMTDKQLDRMAIIECLQFAGAAAIISAIICAVVIFGSERGLTAFINASFVEESEKTRKMLLDLIRIDHVTPFVRIGLTSLTAFAAGCVTSLVMLRVQNNESLSDQIRGSEMKLDTKKSHLLRNSILVIAGAFVLTVAGLRIYSVSAYRRDRNEYAKAGYLNLVDANGCKMNVYSTGAEHGKHTIVGLAGMGVNCFPVLTKALNEQLGKENTIVYPDHAGYGFTDDSLRKQTLEQVAEDCRAGLKSAGFTAPYVLMVHSYGSYYALWWQMKYPDEVEAIIFLDGTELPESNFWFSSVVEAGYPSEADARAEARRAALRTWLGLDRLFRTEKPPHIYGASVLSEEQIRLWDLSDNRSNSAASASEILMMDRSYKELSEMLKPTDIPKLYLSTTPSCEADIREAEEFVKADREKIGEKYASDPETVAKNEWLACAWQAEDYYDNILTQFMERIGNSRYVTIGGDHGIFYAQKPDEVADTILDFLAETTE